jgi:hypothetical protein
MALTEERLQKLMGLKGKYRDQPQYGEAWHIIDGVLVIYDYEDKDSQPDWLPQAEDRDDNGNTSWGREHGIDTGNNLEASISYAQ